MRITRVTFGGVLVATIAACTGYIQGDPGTQEPPPPEMPTPTGSRALDIQPRQQMDPNGGYSAETSLQTLALYHGAYLSQNMIRTIAAAPMIIGGNATTVLDTLHIKYLAWTSSGAPPQASKFLEWVKAELESGMPVMYGVYVSDATTPQTTYDNAVPAIAIQATTPTVFDASDTLTSSDNDGGKVLRVAGTLMADRAGCQKPGDQGGCVPTDVDYGIAILGIVDKQHASLPVNVKVDVDPEPNEAGGDAAVPVNATVVATGLTPGHAYSLLRFDDYTKLPTNATAAQMLAAPHNQRYDFTATDVLYTLRDPNPFQSDGTTYYRCVPR